MHLRHAESLQAAQLGSCQAGEGCPRGPGQQAHPALLLVGERSVVRYVDAAVRPLPASIGDLPTDVGMRKPWPHVHRPDDAGLPA
jgi:hypothetical protein